MHVFGVGKEAAVMLSARRDHPPGLGPVGHSGPRAWQAVSPESSPGRWLSVVVPAKNEGLSLARLVDETAEALRPLCADGGSTLPLAGFEIVVVDDGSTDETQSILRRLGTHYPELCVVRLAWSVGQSGAIAAGFRAARGDWLATLDADLQNDPADLCALWEALPGHDAILGWRATRQDIWWKRLLSWWANRVRNGVLGQSIRDTGCSVRIISRDYALRLPMFRGAHRFFGPLLLREGARVAQCPVSHRRRLHGRSHYGLRTRSLAVVADLLGVAWLTQRAIAYEIIAVDDKPGRNARLFESSVSAGHEV
jgi:glycosyltransferase involved in cell wall biosynthesis